MKNRAIYITSIITFLTLFIFISFIPITITANADEIVETNNILVEKDALDIYISNTDVDKSAGSKGERKTSLYLSEFMKQNNLSYFRNSNDFIHEFQIGINNTSQNVIGVKKANIKTNDTIVISANYDNSHFYHGINTKSIGALDNATGVVCLMSLIKHTESIKLPFNIIYIFYGASEKGNLGSKAFLNNFSTIEKKDILLSINLDSIGCGEYTYYFAGYNANKFKDIFEFNNYNVSKMPIYTKFNILTSFENSAFTHKGMQNDNDIFMKEGIKTISFFSGNLDSISAGYRESKNHEDINHTEKDNPSTLQKYYPDYTNKMNNVTNLIFDTIIKTNFTNTMKNSYEQVSLNFLNNKLIIFGLAIVGVLLLCTFKAKPKLKIKGTKNE